MVFVFLFLTYFTLRISSRIHVATNGIILFFLWLIFHCGYVPHLLNPFICWWSFKLFPCLGYCEQCCNEHRSSCIFLNDSFVCIYIQEWDCWIMLVLYLVFCRTSTLFSIVVAPIRIPTNKVWGFPFLQHLIFVPIIATNKNICHLRSAPVCQMLFWQNKGLFHKDLVFLEEINLR